MTLASWLGNLNCYATVHGLVNINFSKDRSGSMREGVSGLDYSGFNRFFGYGTAEDERMGAAVVYLP